MLCPTGTIALGCPCVPCVTPRLRASVLRCLETLCAWLGLVLVLVLGLGLGLGLGWGWG